MQAALPESHHRCAMGQQKVAVLTTLGLHPYFVYLLTFFIQKIETSLFSNYLYMRLHSYYTMQMCAS